MSIISSDTGALSTHAEMSKNTLSVCIESNKFLHELI